MEYREAGDIADFIRFISFCPDSEELPQACKITRVCFLRIDYPVYLGWLY